jgi:ankyrin repeat protein
MVNKKWKKIFIWQILILILGCSDHLEEIHYAAGKGDLEKVKILVSKDPKLMEAKTSRKGFTPLHYAAWEGQKEVAEFLVANGVDVDIKSKGGITPLHHAKYELAKFLIDKGADVNVNSKLDDYTPLHFASMDGRKKVVELLIEKGAKVNFINDLGSTPLHMAADKAVAEILLKNGAEVNAKDRWGRTPLHSVAMWKPEKEFCELLLEKGADVNVRDKDSKTPLKIAIEKNNTQIVELLRKHGGVE